MPLVSLSGVSVSYGERTLFDSVNLSVATGSRMALVGPNGSGKTTLMRILAGRSVPDTGSVVREKETRVSFVPESGVVHAGLSLREEAEKAFATGAALVGEIHALEERWDSSPVNRGNRRLSSGSITSSRRSSTRVDTIHASRPWTVFSPASVSPDRTSTRRRRRFRRAGRCGSRCQLHCWRPRISCSSTSRRTTSTSKRARGWRSSSPISPAASSSSPTTAIFSTSW